MTRYIIETIIKDKSYVSKTLLYASIDKTIKIMNNEITNCSRDDDVLKIKYYLEELVAFRKFVEEMTARDYFKNNKNILEKTQRILIDRAVSYFRDESGKKLDIEKRGRSSIGIR